MSDYLGRYSDGQADAYAKQIRKVYAQAAREVKRKTAEFMSKHKAKAARMLQDVKEGRISQQDYKDWLRGQVFQGDQWKQKLKGITDTYVNADKKAREMLSGTTRSVFTEAANYTAYDIEKGTRGAVSFDMYDERTVDRLIRQNPKMLPEWKIDEEKDYIWNEKRVQNSILQGIIQGESIADIGNRLSGELASSNAAKMNMFARTAVTGAQNAGRMERLHETEDMGIEVKKKWLATLDKRTRDAHAFLDGQEVGVDEPFVTEEGKKIDYPGDPTAPPELVYNCRCTLIYTYPQYQHLQNAQRRDQETGEVIKDQTYRQWKEARKSGNESRTERTPEEIDREQIEAERREYRESFVREREINTEIADILSKQMELTYRMEEEKKLRRRLNLDYSKFDRFETAQDYYAYLDDLSSKLDVLYAERDARQRPRRSDFANDDEYDRAFDEYLARGRRINSEMQDLEQRFFELSQSVPRGGWNRVELYRQARELGEEGIQSRIDALQKQYDELQKKKEKLQEESESIRDKRFGFTRGSLVENADSSGVAYKPPERGTPHDFKTIVSELGGADQTEGSCASLAFCYVGQTEGFKVLDFRDGDSRYFFSYYCERVMVGIGNETGGEVFIDKKNKAGAGGAIRVLAKAQEGHEYYLACGKHAAIVRIRDGAYEYLELQGPDWYNGWKKLGEVGDRKSIENTLIHRFGCGRKVSGQAYMMDVEHMRGSRVLQTALGYMNTSAEAQHKGVGGYAK